MTPAEVADVDATKVDGPSGKQLYGMARDLLAENNALEAELARLREMLAAEKRRRLVADSYRRRSRRR
jgi:hypothetical protein